MSESPRQQASDNLPEYYRKLKHVEILKGFKNFDDLSNFKSLDDRVRHSRSRNFVLDFADEQAWCAFDLEADAVSKLLKEARPSNLNTRWINVWLPYEQADLLTVLAKTYDFSPRLLEFMKSPPIKHSTKSQQTRTSRLDRIRHPRHHNVPYVKSVSDPSVDVEDQIGVQELRAQRAADIGILDMNQYTLADEVWHWSAVDWGRRFVSLGFNSLYNVVSESTPLESSTGEEEEHPMDRDLPEGKRVWSWLILCDDKTVITINEDPFPYRNGNLDASERQNLLIIRRNLINVFRNCSKAHDSSKYSPIMKLNIRYRVGDSEEESAHRPSDTPGLLFYYIFDDWYSSYSVVFRREHRYSAELDNVRRLMLKRAELAHINRLHHIGRQLGVLRRMYESYELMIDRLLEKQEHSLASLKNSHVLTHHNSAEASMSSSLPHVNESQSVLGASLSSASRVRFERLKYRIRLYALSEIDECLNQKESLVMMNFNLIAIKESFSVERLSRVALLLSKVTILFMPVSILTAYFGCDLSDVDFTSRSYWMWFGIILGVSLLGLLAFSLMSGTLEGSMIYRPMSRRIVDWTREMKQRREKTRERSSRIGEKMMR